MTTPRLTDTSPVDMQPAEVAATVAQHQRDASLVYALYAYFDRPEPRRLSEITKIIAAHLAPERAKAKEEIERLQGYIDGFMDSSLLPAAEKWKEVQAERDRLKAQLAKAKEEIERLQRELDTADSQTQCALDRANQLAADYASMKASRDGMASCLGQIKADAKYTLSSLRRLFRALGIENLVTWRTDHDENQPKTEGT
jgi:chromosome segregation ATPase